MGFVKKYFFMFQRLLDDFQKNKNLKINPEVNSQKLGEYYFLFEKNPKKLNRLIHSFDENGIPLNSSYIDVKSEKLHYYPISIGQFGLAVFNDYLKYQHNSEKELFLRISDWFVHSAIIENSLGAYWVTDVPKPEFKIHAPWKSAFTQSRAISILLRAWQMTGESNYLKLASEALIPFTISIEKGGVAVDLTEEMAFYEEYVAEKPTRILDGAMFSLFGVYDFIRASKDLSGWEESNELAKVIFRKGVNGLKFWLPQFDMGYWAYYNRCEIAGYPEHDPCTIGYLRSDLGRIRFSFGKNYRVICP